MFEQIANFGDSVALVDERKTEVTYSELYCESVRLAEKLSANSVVIIGAKNTKESIVVYIACLIANSAPLLLSSSIEPAKLERYIVEFEPESIFGFEQSEISVSQGFQKIEFRSGIVALVRRENRILERHFAALLLTTSGSTGNPQVVRISKQNLVSNTEAIIQSIGIEQSSVAITTLPMFYTYGLSIINTHLLAGAKIVLNDCSVGSREFWSKLVEEDVTTFGGVPLTYEIINRFDSQVLKGTRVKSITQAGGGMKTDQIRKLIEIADGNKASLWLMYGQTEATARMSVFNQTQDRHHIGSIGKPICGGRFEILATTGQVITESNVEGELIYYGPNVSLGYGSSRKDLFQGDVNTGRLATGDLAYFDSDGLFYITGRKSRFTKLAGKRLNLDDIENWIMRLGPDVACVEEFQKLVVFHSGKIEIRSLKARIVSEFGINSQQVQFKYIEVIPRNSSGKIQYGKLVEMLQQ